MNQTIKRAVISVLLLLLISLGTINILSLQKKNMTGLGRITGV